MLVIEAGGKDSHPLIHMPAGFAAMTTGPFTWEMTTAPQKHALNRPRSDFHGLARLVDEVHGEPVGDVADEKARDGQHPAFGIDDPNEHLEDAEEKAEVEARALDEFEFLGADGLEHLADERAIAVCGLDNLIEEAEAKSLIGFVADEPRFHLDMTLETIKAVTAPFYRSWNEERFRSLAAEFELLDVLDDERQVTIRIVDDEVPEVAEVDAKLVVLSRRMGVGLLTMDRALAKVAELQGVRCLNLQRLADGLRPPLVTGEIVTIELVKEGTEAGQGVGYLPDGSMIVVNDAASLIGSEVDVRTGSEVTTSRGRMYFGTLAGVDADSELEAPSSLAE